MHFTISWRPYTTKILLHCLIVTTPMLAASLVILYVVYANLTASTCPSNELCPGLDLINATSKSDYYINFPAARLAFISSASSTVSFALIGFMMAFAAYVNANALLHASEKDDQESLPSPHQMSLLLRILNAELLVLWDLALSQVKRVFWKREKDTSRRSSSNPPKQKSPIHGVSIGILLAGIIARSVMVFQLQKKSCECYCLNCSTTIGSSGHSYQSMLKECFRNLLHSTALGKVHGYSKQRLSFLATTI
jgi:hypothetical protein